MMPQHFRVPRTLVRFSGPAFLLTIAFLLSPDSLFGQVITGLSILKTCPDFVDPGSPVTCTYSLQNQDPVNGITNLAVTNTFPSPGGPILPITCNQGGSPVTSLGHKGLSTDTCTGSIDEGTAGPCGSTDTAFVDHISATAMDGNLNVAQATEAAFIVLACTPTPTPVVNTPTNTPTNPPTEVPPVPTLSFPMMAMLGLLLAGAGLFLARR
jgi:hypothetical protein